MTQAPSEPASDKVPAVRMGDSRPLLCGVLLCFMLVVMSLAYGYQYRANPDLPLGYFLPFSAVYFLAVGLLCLVGVAPSLWDRLGDRRLAVDVGLAATTFSILMSIYFHGNGLPVPTLPTMAVLVAAVALVATLFGSARALVLALAAGLCVQIALALGNPLDVGAANMLPVIEAGCAKLFSGENPYLADYPGITSVPLMYLPGLLLPYCAPVALGLDLRLLNVAVLVAIVVYASWALDARHRPERLCLGLLPVLFSPPAGQMMIHGHVWLYWLLVVVFVHALATRRHVAAALLLGLILATRQMSVFLAIPAAIYMATRLRPVPLAGYAALTLGVYAAILVPVALTTPEWIDLFYLSATRVGEGTHLSYGNPMNQVSMSGVLTQAGLAGLLQPLQVLALVLFGAVLWAGRNQLTFDRAILLIGIAYLIVIGFNSFLHRYFYFPGLILAALAIAYAANGPLSPADETRRSG